MLTALLGELDLAWPERIWRGHAPSGRRFATRGPGVWVVRSPQWIKAAAFDHNGDYATTIEELLEEDAPRIADIPSAPEWHMFAMCAGQGVDKFYGSRAQMLRDELIKARTTCASCPVVAECLSWALLQRERHGVWGGTSAQQRDGMVKLLADRPVDQVVQDWLASWPAG